MILQAAKRISHVCRIAQAALYYFIFLPFPSSPGSQAGRRSKARYSPEGRSRKERTHRWPAARRSGNTRSGRQLRQQAHTAAAWTHGSRAHSVPPAEAMIVVSEIGEQWSPHTAPARQEAIEITIICPSGNTPITIGIRMLKVPQDVPVAKASSAATRK